MLRGCSASLRTKTNRTKSVTRNNNCSRRTGAETSGSVDLNAVYIIQEALARTPLPPPTSYKRGVCACTGGGGGGDGSSRGRDTPRRRIRSSLFSVARLPPSLPPSRPETNSSSLLSVLLFHMPARPPACLSGRMLSGRWRCGNFDQNACF